MKKLTKSVLAVVLTASFTVSYAQKAKVDTVETKNIEGVVVTALGIKREKKALGYASQEIKSDEVLKSGRTNPIDALNGKISGVQITNSGGQAGGATNVIIRGYSSITGNNQPLYVIDGVPVDNSFESTNAATPISGTPSSNRATDLSPDDIENISVLKGGAATALYGIRAANGAIIITTKKGKTGSFNVDFSSNYSLDIANKYPSISDKFTVGANGAFSPTTTNQWGPLADSGFYPADTFRDIDGDGIIDDISGQKIKVYNDNYKRFFRTGETVRYNATVSGGTDRNTYLVSASNISQDGIVPNQFYKKNSFLFNGSQKFNEKFDVDVKVNYINTKGKYFNNSQLIEALNYFNNNYDVANYPYQDSKGERTYWHPSLSHPMWTVNKTAELRDLDRFIINLGLNYRLLRNLTLSYKVGADTYTENRKAYNSIGTAEFSDTDYLGDLRLLKIKSTDINSDLLLKYNLDFTNDIKLSALLGHNYYRKVYEKLNNYGVKFVVPDLYDINNTIDRTISNSSYTKELMGVYGDLQLSYKNAIFFDVTGRNDWASTLPTTKNSFFYPSTSLSIIFSELMNTKNFYGKLRGSYAKIANIPEPNSLFNTYVRQDANLFGNPAFTLTNTSKNEFLKPETIKQWEIGTELGFFRNKINFEFTYYNKLSTDQIIYAPVSTTTGFIESLRNIGEIENKGIEATLRFNDLIKSEDLSFSSEFNFTRNRGVVNKVGDDGLDQVSLGFAYWGNAEIVAKKGENLGAIYGYTYEHYIPGDLNSPLLLDPITGSPKRSSEKILLGNTNPDFILGWNTSLSYKGFKFGFTLERKQGGQIYNDNAVELIYTGHSPITDNRYYTGSPNINSTQNFSGVDVNGNAVNIPVKLTKTFYTTVYVNNDQNFIEDASWWRLRNIYLGYNLVNKFTKQIGISGLEFTFSARNMWLKTKYSGVDPEVNSLGTSSNGNGVIGIDALSIPNTKSYDLGIKIKF